MNGDEIQVGMRQAGFGAGMGTVKDIVLDNEYALPDRAWLTGVFGPAFKRDLEKLGLSDYVAEANDCDDFALLAMALARIAHARTGKPKTALGFGMIGYLYQHNFPPVGHAINFAWVRENGIRKPVFWEPQLQREQEMWPQEIESGMFYMI